MIYQYKYRDCTEVDINIEGQGRPIVFVHGWGVNCDLYIHQYKELSRDHKIITYDLRGHNPTKRSFTQPGIDTLAEDLIEIFIELDLKDAICVGWSMGAFVTWRALDNADFKKRLTGIVSIDMSPLASNSGEWNLGMKGAQDKASMIERAKLIRENWSATVNQFVPKMFASGSSEKWSDQMDDIIKDAIDLDATVLSHLWESIIEQDFREQLATTDVPMLIAYGEKSNFYTPATSEYIVQSAKNAALAPFPSSGHAPHFEEPQRFNAYLRQFISHIDEEDVVEEACTESA